MAARDSDTHRALASRQVSAAEAGDGGVVGSADRAVPGRRRWVERLLLRRPVGPDASVSDPVLALASKLAERESEGRFATEVVLALRSPEDAAWAAAVAPWLAAHGRQVWVRTAVRLPGDLVRALDQADGRVELELAHPNPAVQRALLGDDVDPVASLLLQAQHLRALGIPVRARLGPLLPGLHETGVGSRARDLDALLDHVHAASIRDVTPVVGALDGQRLARLASAVPPGVLVAIGSSFGLTAAELLQPSAVGRGRHLARALGELFRQRLRRAIGDAGLRRGEDLGPASPPVAAPGPQMAPVASGDLFATTPG